jgi:hypothetical protein
MRPSVLLLQVVGSGSLKFADYGDGDLVGGGGGLPFSCHRSYHHCRRAVRSNGVDSYRSTRLLAKEKKVASVGIHVEEPL